MIARGAAVFAPCGAPTLALRHPPRWFPCRSGASREPGGWARAAGDRARRGCVRALRRSYIGAAADLRDGSPVGAAQAANRAVKRRLRGRKRSAGMRIPTIVTAHTDERDRCSVRASVVFRV